jgi:hypothetical protein
VVPERYAELHRRKTEIFERYDPERDHYGTLRERSDPVSEQP